MSTNAPAPRRGSRRTDTPAGKLLAAGLAGATCIGLVGVIGIRSATDAAANSVQSASVQVSSDQAAADLAAADAIQAGTANLASSTSSEGLTRAQLDDYAAQLSQERQRLTEYRSYLVDVAAQLQAAANNSGAVVTDASMTVTKKPAKPKAQQPQPQQRQQAKPKAHAQTQGS